MQSHIQANAVFLNKALNAYVATFPQEQRLVSYLASHGQEEKLGEVKAILDAVIQSTEEVLWSEKGGVLNRPGF